MAKRWAFVPSVHVNGGVALIMPMRTRPVSDPASVDAKSLGGCRGDESWQDPSHYLEINRLLDADR